MILEEKEIEDTKHRLGNKMIIINLQLGDVIKITTDDSSIHNEYYIEYINREKIKAIQTNSLEKIDFIIDEQYELNYNGVKVEGQIALIYRQKEQGFARQNKLLVDTWISIHFEINDEKKNIIGQIVDLPEYLDMITILTYPEKETLYINFNYEGLSDHLHIHSIKIISSPYTNEEFFEMVPDIETINEEMDWEREQHPGSPPILELGKMVALGRIEDIVYYVNADESQFRYDLETQKNDLLNNMLSKLPKAQRTVEELSNIALIIERYRQLRQEFSVFDGYGNITGFIQKGAKWKPLVKNLLSFERPLYWIIPVGTQTKVLNLSLPEINEEGEEGTSILPAYDEYKNIYVNSNEPSKELNAIIQEFKNGPNIENRYVKMLQQLYRYYLPFQYNLQRSNILTTIPIIKPNINVMINNGDDFSSNVVETLIAKMGGSQTVSFNVKDLKYVNGVYLNEDMVIHASKITSDIRMTYTREKVNNTRDHIDLISILTLPDQVIQFSRVNLPGTNIMKKAELGNTYIHFSEIFKRNMNNENLIQTIHLDNLDNEENVLKLEKMYENTSFIGKKKLMNYVTNTTIETEKNKQIYETYLNLMIPQSKLLFNLVKKYIDGRMSVMDVISYMEPFLIYSTDISFKFYEVIKQFVDNKCREYKRQLKNKNILFHKLREHIVKLNKTVYRTNICCKLIDIIEEDELFQDYGLFGIETDSSKIMRTVYPLSSELLNYLTKIDYHRLLSYKMIDTKLLVHEKTNEMIQIQEARAQQLEEKSREDNCNEKYVIAKVYNNETDLKRDDGISPIYYDRELNTGQSCERDITEQEVEENDIAVLYQKGEVQFQYYRRKGDKWRLDNNIDSSVFSGDLLCALRENCIQSARDGNNCINMDMVRMNITRKNIENVKNEFDRSMSGQEKILTEEVNQQFYYYKKILPKIIRIEKNKQFGNYQYTKYKLGEKMKKEILREDEVIQSPYLTLREVILGQSNFDKKQRDIITFKEQMTMTLNGNSSDPDYQYWFYCNKTNTKLLPKFIYDIAYTYINDSENYVSLIDRICQTQGKISDDGDKWVDKYSGYTIKNIDYDVDEGYEGGFRVSSRAKLESDTMPSEEVDIIVDDVKTQGKENPIYMKYVYYKTIIHVIDVLSKLLRVSLDGSTQNEFIANVVYQLMSKISSKEQFIKANENKEKAYGTEEYTKYVNRNLLFYTLAVYIVALQTNIPTIKINGHPYTMSEYPLQPDGSKETFYYIIRTLLKEKSLDDTPWTAIFHKSKEKVKTMKFEKVIEIFGSIEGPVITLPMVIYRSENKTTYLESSQDTRKEEDIYSISRWTQFLPPLFDVHLKYNIENISPEFKKSMFQKIHIGDIKQAEDINVLRGKIILFSIGLFVSIQQIVNNEPLVLESTSGRYYLENSCCNSSVIGETVIEYFSNKNRNVDKYITDAKYIQNILTDIKELTKSPFLFSRENRKNIYPPISHNFNEQTIYMAFISYCNFQSLKPMNDRLKQLCQCKQKPAAFNINDTIQEKIAKIKASGKNYNNEDLVALLKYVGENNIISIHIENGKQMNPYEMMKFVLDDDVLEKYSKIELETQLDLEKRGTVLEMPSLLQKISDWLGKRNIVDVYDDKIKSSDRNELLDDIIRENTQLKNKIFSKIKKKQLREDNARSKFEKLFTTDNQQLYNTVKFIQYYIYFFSSICPKMLIDYKFDKVSSNLFSNNVPLYQGLSLLDNNQVTKMTEKYYQSLIQFYNKNEDNLFLVQQKEGECGSWFCELLSRVRELTMPIVSMMRYTPILSNIDKTMPILDETIALSLLEYYLLKVFDTYREIYNEMNIDNEKVYNDLIDSFVGLMIEHKITISYTYQSVVDIEFKSREIEKYLMTDRLKDMVASERKVDNLLKKHKIGLWGIGLRKEFFKYSTHLDKHEEQYVKELEKVEAHMRQQNKLQGIKTNITQEMLLEMFEESMIEDIKKQLYMEETDGAVRKSRGALLQTEDGDGDGDLDEDLIVDDYEYDSDDDDHNGYNRDS